MTFAATVTGTVFSLTLVGIAVILARVNGRATVGNMLSLLLLLILAIALLSFAVIARRRRFRMRMTRKDAADLVWPTVAFGFYLIAVVLLTLLGYAVGIKYPVISMLPRRHAVIIGGPPKTWPSP